MMIDGTILKGIGGFYYVGTKKGVYECRARGIFRKNKTMPLVGDHVGITVLDEAEKKGSLDRIDKRTNQLIRPRVANVDQAVIVFAAVSPQLNLDLLDRFLLCVEEQNLDVVICINKIDLDREKKYMDVINLYESIGYRIYGVSTVLGQGIEELRQELLDKISVFAGPSGVGKSSLINQVAPGFSLNTGEISKKIERGKHTTRHAELMEFCPNSYIVDSPGFTSLYVNHIPQTELKNYFREFKDYEPECRFQGCSHTHEPDCAVKAQVGKGIQSIRYHRYLSIYQELEEERRK